MKTFNVNGKKYKLHVYTGGGHPKKLAGDARIIRKELFRATCKLFIALIGGLDMETIRVFWHRNTADAYETVLRHTQKLN